MTIKKVFLHLNLDFLFLSSIFLINFDFGKILASNIPTLGEKYESTNYC